MVTSSQTATLVLGFLGTGRSMFVHSVLFRFNPFTLS